MSAKQYNDFPLFTTNTQQIRISSKMRLSSSSSLYLSVINKFMNKSVTCRQDLQGSQSTYSGPNKILK